MGHNEKVYGTFTFEMQTFFEQFSADVRLKYPQITLECEVQASVFCYSQV